MTVAAGGSLVRVSFAGRGERRGGGPKRESRGLSPGSRLALLRRYAAIDRTALAASGWRVYFVHLTYGRIWPEDPQRCKAHLKAFRKRLERRFGGFAGYWRLGVQARGAWHFHLLLFVPSSFGPLKELRRFVPVAWHQVTGDASDGHLRAGTRVEQVKGWKKGTSAAEKYQAREEGFPTGVATGRVWGTWNEKLLPTRWRTVEVAPQDAHRVKEALRASAGVRGTGASRGLAVFLGHEDAARLLESLGYRYG